MSGVPTPERMAELRAEIARAQQEYTTRIQQAGAQGRFNEIPELVAEMERVMANLAAQMSGEAPAEAPTPPSAPPPAAPAVAVAPPAAPEPVEPPPPPPPPPPAQLYDQSLCGLDLPLTVYDGDRDMYKLLIEDESFGTVAGEILAGYKPHNARRELLKSAMKLTPRMAPKVFDVVDRCRSTLELKPELEVYVCPDVQFNAFCYPPREGKILLGITSALLEKFDMDELAFIIGHELGHALFQHWRFPVRHLLENGNGRLSPLHAMRLYAWKRNAELSSDRVGLICCQSFDAAASAFFKLSSGITDNTLAFQLNEYIEQFADLKAEMKSDDVSPEDWYSTHPFSPIRVKALSTFNRSQTYMKLTGQTGGDITEEALEAEIKSMMSLMEPTYLTESTEVAGDMRRFVFLSGYMIAKANGTIDDTEIKALTSLLDAQTVDREMKAIDGVDDETVVNEIGKIAGKLEVMLPTVSKLNLIKDLTVISHADGSVEDSELKVLYNVCNALGIRTEFVDQVLDEAFGLN